MKNLLVVEAQEAHFACHFLKIKRHPVHSTQKTYCKDWKTVTKTDEK